MNSLSDKRLFGSDNIFDVGRYINLLKKKWLRIILFSLVCTAIAAAVAMSLPSKYIATATLKLEGDTTKAISIESVVGIDTSKQEYYLTEFEIIKSRAIAERVIERLELYKLPEFNPSLQGEPSVTDELVWKALDLLPYKKTSGQEDSELVQDSYITEQRILSRFNKGLSIVPVRRTHLVKISYESKDPQLAADIANAVGEAYIEEGLRARLDVEAEASTWISKRLEELREKLNQSELALSSYLESEQLVDNSGIDTQAGSALEDLQSQLNMATDKRIELESKYSTLVNGNLSNEQVFAATEVISLHPQVVTLNSNLASVDKEITELSKRYGPKHKKMIAAYAKRDSLKAQLNTTVRQLVSGIGKELKTAKAREELIQKEMASRVDNFQELSIKKRKYDSLVLDVETNKNILNLFVNRQKETSAVNGFETQSARFTDRATPPIAPAKPNKKLIVVLVFLVSALFAVVVVLFRESLKNTIDTVKGCEERLGLIPLGSIPQVTNRESRNGITSELFFDKDSVAFSESVRSLRTLLSLMKRDNKFIAIASSLPNEGKTTTAINLAIAYAQTERTVVIDADLRRSSIAERFGLSKFEKGLVNHVVMGEPLKECLHKDEKSGVTILPAGMIAPNPQDVLSSDRFVALLNKLQEHFDRVIIDTPPALTVSDSFIIGKHAESVFLVVKANSTRVKTFRNTISHFSNHGVKVEGVILNQVKTKISKNEYSYYNYAAEV